MKRFLACLLALCLLSGFAFAQEFSAPAPSTLSTIGRAVVENSPTQAVLSFEMSSFGETVGEAQTLMESQLSALYAVLEAQGISQKAISSSRYDVHSRYEYHYTKMSETELLTGYDVEVAVQARVADAHNAAAIIDAVNLAGLDCGYDLLYETIRTSEAFDDALIRAAQEAMRKAGLLAESSGLKLYELISLEETLEEDAVVVRAIYTVK